MKKFLPQIRRLLIYLVIMIIALPASVFLMMVSAPKAQAAEVKKTTPTKVVSPAPSAPKPTLKMTKGFQDKLTYRQGEKIKVIFVFEGKVLSAWAKTGSLEANFPETINLTPQGKGGWLLVTPVFSPAINLGQQTLKVYVENSSGIAVFNFSLTLERKPFALEAKTVVGEKEIRLAWQPVKSAQKYLIQWNAQDETTFHLRVVEETKITLDNLTGGTVYEIEISPIGKEGLLAESQKRMIKTLGIAPVRQVAGTQEKKALAPAIGSGVSTVSPKIAKTIETPAPSESPKNEETKPTGWNRLLVALAILIIAAGAAIGGYYGYEWWAAKSQDGEPPKSGSSSRW